MGQRVTQFAAVARFSCLGADCPDTCCNGWNIPSDARQQAWMAQNATQLQAVIDPATNTMRRADACSSPCSQLSGGICGLHRDYGTDALSDSCHFFPRITHRISGENVMSASIACPEMLRLILTMPKPFEKVETTLDRLPIKLRPLALGTTSEADATASIDHCLALAQDESRSPEAIMDALLEYVWQLEGDNLPAPIAKQGDAHALYYALALTRAFVDEPVTPAHANLLPHMASALDCSIGPDRALVLGPNAGTAITTLQRRWTIDARAALAPTLRRYIQAQLTINAFPYGHMADTTMRERAAILVQRFATTRLALMCHVEANGIAPDETTTQRVIQGIARLLDNLSDVKLIRMIHQDSGWNDAARLRGLLAS